MKISPNPNFIGSTQSYNNLIESVGYRLTYSVVGATLKIHKIGK